MLAMWCSCTENSRSLLARWPIHFFMTSIRWSSESSSRMTAACACGHHRSSPKPISEYFHSPPCQRFVVSSKSYATFVFLRSGTETEWWAKAAPNDQEQLFVCDHRGISLPCWQRKRREKKEQTFMWGSTSSCLFECGNACKLEIFCIQFRNICRGTMNQKAVVVYLEKIFTLKCRNNPNTQRGGGWMLPEKDQWLGLKHASFLHVT